jgi:excisionase family DNA binding protein
MLNAPLTVPSTAVALGVSKPTVFRLLREGRLGFIQVSPRRIVIPRSEVDRYLMENFVPAVTRKAGGRV